MNRLLLTAVIALLVLVSAAARAAPPTEKEIDQLFERIRAALKDPDAAVRRKAVKVLDRLAGLTEHDLIRALHDEDKSVRVMAATHLKEAVGAAQVALPDLIQALKDPDKEVRVAAVSALATMGSKAKDAIPALIEVLRDAKSGLRGRAAAALGMIGRSVNVRAVVPSLVEALKLDKNSPEHDPAAPLPTIAIEALAHIGTEARAATPALLAIVHDRGADLETQGYCLNTLREIGAPEAVVLPLLIEFLKDKKRRRIHSSVAGMIGNYGARARCATAALVAALDVHDVKDPQLAADI
jgi:HEAT repeat protein